MIRRLYYSAIIALCLSIAASGPAGARSIGSKAGTSAFPFLKINVGARSCAMGGAFTGLADDESALYYNPAGIVLLEGKRFVLEYLNYFADLQSGFIGFSKPVSPKVAIGFSLDYLNYGDFVNTDINGNNLGTFGGSDLMFAGTFAMKLNDQFSAGGSAKLIYEKLEKYSATGLAMDLSARYASDRNRYMAGILVQNLGFQMSGLGSEKDPLPLTLRIGGAVKPRGLPLKVAADLIIPVDNRIDIAVGAELLSLKPLFIRAGWNSFGSNYRSSNSTDKLAGFALGVGFEYRNMQLSYSYSPAADLGNSHRITLSGGF